MPTAADRVLVDKLVLANRILYRQGIVDGFGHVSVRHDKDPKRFLLSRNMAPALVTPKDILDFFAVARQAFRNMGFTLPVGKSS